MLKVLVVSYKSQVSLVPDEVVGEPGIVGEVGSAGVDNRHQRQELPDDDGDVSKG